MGMKIGREHTGLFCGGLGLIEAFALVFIASVPGAPVETDDQFPSWKASGFVQETDLYIAEIPSSLMDPDDAGCEQCAIKSRPLADFFRQFNATKNLVATGNRSAPVPALTRLAPKRSPPLAPLFV
jgi:hypothetical protein